MSAPRSGRVKPPTIIILEPRYFREREFKRPHGKVAGLERQFMLTTRPRTIPTNRASHTLGRTIHVDWKNKVYQRNVGAVSGRLYNFGVGKAELKSEHEKWLILNVAPTLYSSGSLTVIGLTSRTDKGELNLALSRRRTESVVRFLRGVTSKSRQCERLRTAATVLNPQLECVYYRAQQNLTFQYAVILAPLRMTDSEQEVTRKLRVAAAYVDILIARRVWKFRAIDYSTM